MQFRSLSEKIFYGSLRTVLPSKVKVLCNYKPEFLINPKTKHKLEYDFYIPKFKVAFEIQGKHHFDDMLQIEKDAIKCKISEEHSISLYPIAVTQNSPHFIRGFIKFINKNRKYKLPVLSFHRATPKQKELRKICSDRSRDYKKQIEHTYLKSHCTIAFKADGSQSEKQISILDKSIKVEVPLRNRILKRPFLLVKDTKSFESYIKVSVVKINKNSVLVKKGNTNFIVKEKDIHSDYLKSDKYIYALDYEQIKSLTKLRELL